MEVNFWYLAIAVVFIVLFIPALVIRVSLERRKQDRRKTQVEFDLEERRNKDRRD